ncbi:hypothetical protein [Streptomyces mirabilis]|uniref:hypothetical protein n=1 Tax=Streptomyces mirabilis TaxID=68239 RepID=UPI0036D10444
MSTATIGHVTRERDEQIIIGDRELVGQMLRIQFTIGDQALEIEPMQSVGGLIRPLAKSRSASTCRWRSTPMTWDCRSVQTAATGSPQSDVSCRAYDQVTNTATATGGGDATTHTATDLTRMKRHEHDEHCERHDHW